MPNIIKDSISLSDYINYENNEKLYKKEPIANNKLIQKKNDQELFNLSINEITNNFSKEFINVLNDIVNLVHIGSDNLIKDFYRNYIIELYDLSLFKIKVKDALKVIKKTEEVAIKHLNEQDMVINNLINEAIDIFVLKDKEKSEAGLKNFYFLWNSLVDNFDTLLKEI